MRIKAKLTIGTTLLFMLLLTLGVISTLFINRLASDSSIIIQDNYVTLEYCRDMQKAMNKLQSARRLSLLNEGKEPLVFHENEIKQAQQLFETTLLKEEHNITEAGEKEAIAGLKEAYQEYLNLFNQPSVDIRDLETRYNLVQERIIEIFNINMGAMNAKNLKAKNTGNQAILYVSIVATITFLVAFTVLLNFPGYIANPLIEITGKIKEISKKNYAQRLVYPGRRDELGDLAVAFNSMVEKLEAYEKSNIAELQTEKSRIDSIVRNLNEGILLLDEKKRIKVINPIAADLLGVNVKDILDKYAPDIAIQNDLCRELIKNIEQDISLNGKPLRITVGNEENFFKKEVFIVYRENPETRIKETAGYIISLRNITEYKKLDLAKTNFIAVVSHELKTPISSINLSLKLLDDQRIGSLNEEQKKLVRSVKDETIRLSKITGELLDISQVETGNIRLTIEDVNPEDIIKFSEEVLRPHLKDKEIELINEISSGLKLVKADLEKTVWVMTNLLINAVRYTPEHGKIRVSVHPSLKEMRFSVEDTGPGIDPKNKERIFQRFVQVDSKKQREGVGLGLAISKEFIQEQGGKIWVESELGVGSKFVFTLPLV